MNNNDIIFVTKTWLSDRLPDSILAQSSNYPGYIAICKDRLTTGGGSVTFVIKKIGFRIVDISQYLLSLDICIIDLVVSGVAHIRVFCIYFPPTSSLNESDTKKLCSPLKFGSESSQYIFVRNFNFHILSGLCPNHTLFLEAYGGFSSKGGFKQFATEPTVGLIIFLIYSYRLSLRIRDVTVNTSFTPSGTCDHNSIFFSMYCPKNFLPCQTPSYNFCTANYDGINAFLHTYDSFSFI